MSSAEVATFVKEQDDEAQSKVLDLFREHTVVEVRDIKLDLSNKIDNTRRQFTKELQKHYHDILNVTNDVEELLGYLKEGDVLFMDLCFKDDVYRVNKIGGESSHDLNIELSEQRTSSHTENHKSSLGVSMESDARNVLIVSTWTLAIVDFISRFNTSPNSAKLLDKVLQEYDNLRNHANKLAAYDEIIKSKNDEFLTFIIHDDVCQGMLTVSQWVGIYNLVFKNEEFQLKWGEKLQKDLEALLFSCVLDKYTEDLQKDDLIKDFVDSQVFQTRLNEKILKDINIMFEQLNHLLEESSERTEGVCLSLKDDISRNIDITQLVEESRLYAMGLDSPQRISIYKIVEPLIDLLCTLKAHGGDSKKIESSKETLIEKLTQCLPKSESLESQQLETMDAMVSGMIETHNNENYTKLINQQITNLRHKL